MNRRRLISVSAALMLLATAFAEGVRYRGIFVNDEDWGLRPWAVRHFVVDKMESTWKIKE